MATAQPPAPPAKVSVFEDLVDIFASPAEVFARRVGGNAWVPLAIIVVLAGIIYFATQGLMQPVFDAEFNRAMARQMARDPSVTAAQMEAGRAMMQKVGGLFVIIGIPISILFTGVLVWLAGKIFGATESIADAIVIATYAWFPRVISMIVGAVIAVMADPAKLNSMFSVTLSAGKLLDPDTTSHSLFVLAGRLDVFIIWQTVLLGIGISVMGKISRANGLIAGAILWLIGTGAAMALQR